MRIFKQIIIAIIIFGYLYPCSCLEPPPPEEAYMDADVVFSGEVTNIVVDESGYYHEVSFEIIDVWKGEDLEEITLLTEIYSDTCGYEFQADHEYLVYAYSYNWGIYTNICTRTNLLEYANEDLDYLNGMNNNQCTTEECGPPPMMPNYLCYDGITIAGPGDCIESTNGECFWEIIECPTIIGYLRENEISDCQDECSQFFIEPEVFNQFISTPLIFWDSINIDLYKNRFVEVNLGQEVTCVECSAFQVLEINLSENCEFIVDCFQDPCINVEECGNNTTAECIPHFCGGCYADFYDLDGNLVDCIVTIEECNDLTGIDFGVCTMVLGIGYVNGECNYVSGCDWIIDGIDYSNSFFNSIEECEEICEIDNSIDLGDINGDSDINILDVVLMVSLILSDEYSLIADVNEDNLINVLDIVLLIEMILNPVDSIQINSGTSYGECWGYCVFELELDNSSALFKASSWGWDPYGELPDLILEDNLNQIVWQQLVDLIDFEYFQSLDDVYGCPDCADGGAEFIEIIYDGVVKLVTFDAYTEIDGIQELTLFLRDLRIDYWNQINQPQECYIVPEVGPCDGICPTFYYNQSTNECEEFITGCCGVEAFNTLQECQNICE